MALAATAGSAAQAGGSTHAGHWAAHLQCAHGAAAEAQRGAEPLVLGVASAETAALDGFRGSLARLGIEHKIIGLDQPWRGFLNKLVYLRAFITSLRDRSRPVCFTDAYDLLFCRPLRPLRSGKIVVGAESGGMISAPMPHWREMHGLSPLEGWLPMAFVNSGFVFGTAEDLVCMLDWCIAASRHVRYDTRKKVLYNLNTTLKALARGKSWEPTTPEELQASARLPRDPHGFDQVLVAMYADAHPQKIHLDRGEAYCHNNFGEERELHLTNCTTKAGAAPAAVHVPYVRVWPRRNFYTALNRSLARSTGT
jgi:hypothetical protein